MVQRGNNRQPCFFAEAQPLGNSRFLDAIEQATGQRREPKPRGRPRKPADAQSAACNPHQLGLTELDG